MAEDQESGGRTTCSYCGEPAGGEALGVHTHREQRKGRRDLRVEDHHLRFCRDEHAGRFFAEGRLPTPEFARAPKRSSSWADRGYYAAMAVLLAVVVVLMALGASVVVDWLTR